MTYLNNKSLKSIKLEDICKIISESIYPEIDKKLLNQTINNISREINDINTNNMLYPLEKALNISGLKSFSLEIELKNLNKIKSNYYPFILVTEHEYLLVTSKTTFGYNIRIKDEIKKSSLKQIIHQNDLKKDSLVSILMFEQVKSLELNDSHHSPQFKLFSLLKTEKKDLFVVISYSLIIGLLSLVIPVAIQSLVNTIAFATLIQPLIVLTMLVVFALSFESILTILRTYIVELIQRRIFVRVTSDLSYRLPRVKIQAFDKDHGPELVNRFFDVLTVQKSASTLLIDGLSILVQTIVGMVVLAFYHPILLGFDLLLIFCIIFILFVLTYGAVQSSIKESKIKYKVVAWLEEIAMNVTSFKSSGGYVHAMKSSDILIREYLKARKKHFSILLRLFSSSLFLQVVASSSLLGIGGWLVMEQQLSIGQLVAAEIIVASIVSGFTKFGKQLETYYDLLAAVDKLEHLTSLEIERKGGEFLENIDLPLNLKFNDITFSYNNGPNIFYTLNFELKAGSILAFYAGEGKGKSTIAELIYGLRKIKSGIIEINRTDIELLNMDIYRENVSLVSNVEIFHGTVIDNIRMGRSYISLSQIRTALEKADLWEKILMLPSGLETILSTGGSPLSKGMCIKLMVARAIVADSSLIIFDSIFDGMEEKSIRHIFSNAFDLTKTTIFITTSNKEIAENCDSIFNLEENILNKV
ncbi:MAG: ATP-binding cassette domain-containing protein [Candidatus Sericytochromatia bacterium]|nr:ATP-binding cassette domain-containing protein [Candidatus Sericytochromatia bacterium]